MIDNEHALAVVTKLFLPLGQLTFLDLDPIFLGKITQGVKIADLLMLHNEMNSRSTLATGKTLTDILGRRNIKGGRLIRMKRTKTDVVDAPLTQGDKLGNNVDNIGGADDSIDGRLVYHAWIPFIP